MGVGFGNGVMRSTLQCCDETKGLLWWLTHGCATWHVLVSRNASHDPLWSYTDVLSSHESFLGYFPYLIVKILISTLFSEMGILIVEQDAVIHHVMVDDVTMQE
jgi:hypothetical protein